MTPEAITGSGVPKEATDEKNSLKGLKIGLIATVSYHLVSQLGGQAEYLRGLGMSVVLVSSAGPETAKIQTGEDLQYEIVEIPRSLSPLRDMVALIRLTQFFFRHHFDLVHSTTPKAGLLTALAAFIAMVPIRFHTFTGQPWVTLKGPLRWASRMADRLIGFLDTKCYADSGSQARFLIAEGIISPRKMSVIGHGSLAGVDLGRFNPDRWSLAAKQEHRRELSISPSSTLLIFVGRITPDKGISELLNAFSGLLGMNYDVDLLLVGPQDRDRGGTGSLDLSQAEKCPRIHAIGYSDCPERHLTIADIFCLPSYREGFGTVVMEAAAMGLPTVGTAIYGLTDAVADGETGLLVPPRDAPALREAIRRLLDCPDERIRMGKAARQRCNELFDAAKVNASVAEEYRNILRMKRRIPDGA
jgi:glycosyltransferase involved in cell wall biosynthesis